MAQGRDGSNINPKSDDITIWEKARQRAMRALLAVSLVLVAAFASAITPTYAATNGTTCGVIDDASSAEQGASGFIPALFLGRAATIYFNSSTCSVGDAPTNKYNLSAASKIMKVLNNVSTDGTQGFTPGISVAYGGSVTNVLLGGVSYANGTQISVDVAAEYKKSVQFDFSGTTYNFAISKEAGGTAISGFTICEGNSPTAAPSITNISPSNGPQAGGTSVTITGTNLCGLLSVTFGGSAATVTASTQTSLTVTAPAHAGGAVDVVVTNFLGAATSSGGFTYDSPVEIDVSGNSQSIVSGDTTPSVSDDTDFGNVGVSASVAHTFTISNSGTSSLNLTGSPRVSISGTNASDFALTTDASTPVAGGGNTTFTVTFTPGATGLRTATVTIANNDADEGTYTFAIQGTGVITSGDITIIERTSPNIAGDGTFTFTSSATELNGLSITTSGNVGSSGAVNLNSGSITLAQDEVTGWTLSSITCSGDTDSGSVYDVANRTVTIDLDGGESIVCTFTSVRESSYVRTRTQRIISNFMSRRADKIVSNDPDLSARLSRTNGGQAPGTAAFNGDKDQYQLAFQGSLGQMMASLKGDGESGVAAGDGGQTELGGIDAWIQGTLSHGKSGDSKNDMSLLYLGVDYNVTPTVIAGVIVQFDWIDEEDNVQNTSVDGQGWMVGPYLVARVHENLIFDTRAAWGMSDNTVSPFGTYRDKFRTDRWMLRGRFTGDFHQERWTFQPYVDAKYFREDQHSYTDSLGNLIPSQSIELGRLTFGPKVIYDLPLEDAPDLSFNFGVSGLWDFQRAAIVDLTTGLAANGGSNFRARADGGVSVKLDERFVLSAQGYYDGAGVSGFEDYGGSLRLNLSF